MLSTEVMGFPVVMAASEAEVVNLKYLQILRALVRGIQYDTKRNGRNCAKMRIIEYLITPKILLVSLHQFFSNKQSSEKGKFFFQKAQSLPTKLFIIFL